MRTHLTRLFCLTLASLPFMTGTACAESEDETAWNTHLKQALFNGKTIEEDNQVIEITAPYRAEDPALVPIQVSSKFPQTADHYIRNITLVIDNNPVPFSASFDFTPDSGRADIATRMRFNAYTHVRAIAETNDGKLHMTKAFVKASGGCSAPIGTDIEAAMARLGKMKFKFDSEKATMGQANAVQLLVSHPNITGLQMDQISRMIKPAHYVDEVKVSFNGKPVMTAKTDIAISADPNFRFYFQPNQAGELKAEIRDNLGNRYSSTQAVSP